MPLDTRLPASIEPPAPLDVTAIENEQLALQRNRQLVQSGEADARAKKRALEADTKLGELVQRHTTVGPDGKSSVDYRAIETGLAGAGYGQRALELETKRLADEKSQRENRKAELENHDKEFDIGIKRAERFGSLAGTVTDQASLRRAVGMALSEDLLDEKQAQQILSQPWSPEVQASMAQIQQSALKAKDQIAEARAKAQEERKLLQDQIDLETKTLDRDVKKRDEEERKADPDGLTKADRAKLAPTSQREYDAAVKGGFRGSYNDFLTADANRKAPKTTVNVNAPQKTFENEMALRKEVDAHPIVKSYNEVKTQAERAESAFKDAIGGASANSADQVLITALNKMLDPSSVVREGEYARTASGQSLANQVKGWVDKVQRGGAGLSQSERESVMDTIRKLKGSMEKTYRPVEDQYKGMAKEYGFNPDRVISGVGKTATAGPKAGEEDEGYVFMGGNPADAKNWKKKK